MHLNWGLGFVPNSHSRQIRALEKNAKDKIANYLNGFFKILVVCT